MEIIRVIDKYQELFALDDLNKRNCFVAVDNNNIYVYIFKIYDGYKATIFFENVDYLNEVIEEYRFYNYRISEFYASNGEVIKIFPLINTFEVPIDILQPSQFYIDEKKASNIESWIFEEDIAIPIVNRNGFSNILDGHTRLYVLKRNGIEYVKVYIDESFSEESALCIDDFVYLAKEMNITKITDLKVVSHEEYKNLWYKFCDEYFSTKRK